MFYSSLVGIRCFDFENAIHMTAPCYGQEESVRFQNISLFLPADKPNMPSNSAEINLDKNFTMYDVNPMLIATGFEKNRFYIFSNRHPDDIVSTKERDIYNEKPSQEEILSALKQSESKRDANLDKVLF
ncbi:MAG: Peptidylprolyl isomerase domain and WD repeat containing protein 1 [Paramarteilia canceri]